MRKAPANRPSPRKRLAYGILGGVLGGIIGIGFVTSSPVPPDTKTLFLWGGGLAVVCGTIAALSPDGFWRPHGGWRNRR